MPVYEYRCGGCGKEFERYLPSPAANVTCPGCESVDVKRRLSVFAMKSHGADVATMPTAGGACCGGGCSCH
jgi:putative FmdB family regulatory protein